MLDNLHKYTVVLASNSPRRQELCKSIGLSFRTEPSQGEESFPDSLSAENVAEFLAIQKADYFTNFSENQLYITADTVVISNSQVLGKPTNIQQAIDMLGELSGKTHTVVTGVCIKSKTKQISFSTRTKVSFSTLTAEEILHYVEQYQPFDKAGSYGIQEWIGMIGIEGIEGSYFNVVGLPTHALYTHLKTF